MRWVKETLPVRVRERWLLRILRLTSSRRAGTARALVAVGMPRLASMLVAVRAAAPVRGWPLGWALGAAGAVLGTAVVGTRPGGAAAEGVAVVGAAAPFPLRSFPSER